MARRSDDPRNRGRRSAEPLGWLDDAEAVVALVVGSAAGAGAVLFASEAPATTPRGLGRSCGWLGFIGLMVKMQFADGPV